MSDPYGNLPRRAALGVATAMTRKGTVVRIEHADGKQRATVRFDDGTEETISVPPIFDVEPGSVLIETVLGDEDPIYHWESMSSSDTRASTSQRFSPLRGEAESNDP